MSADTYVESYRRLSQDVRAAGLISRRYGFYVTRMISWVLILATLVLTVIVIGETWYQLIIAGLIGMVMAQLGFLSNEAAHRVVFGSRTWNE